MSGRVATVVIALVMVPVLWFAVDLARDGSRSSTEPGAPSATPTVSSSATPRPTASATATTKPTSKPTTKPTNKPTDPALPRIGPAAPRRLASGTFLDVGFDESVEARNGTLRSASTGEVARWGSRGLPGSPGTDTVYVVGSTRADGESAFAALPRLKPGAKVTVRTDRGRLTYTVVSAADRPTGGLASNDAFAARVPGRLILVGLRVDSSGDATGRAYVVVARLSAARPS